MSVRMALVKTYYNTEADGEPVADDVPLEEMPCTFHGPFDNLEDAMSWMENDYPDGDTDVHDQVADWFDVPGDILERYINAPESIWGDEPDEDIRPDDDSREIHGP